jgi:hypothetical protein
MANGGVDVGVSGDDLGDVRGESAADGVGDEDAPEVVWVEVQGAAVGVGQGRWRRERR